VGLSDWKKIQMGTYPTIAGLLRAPGLAFGRRWDPLARKAAGKPEVDNPEIRGIQLKNKSRLREL